MTIKILIGPEVCGFKLRSGLLAQLFETFPEQFGEPLEVSDLLSNAQSWSAAELEDYFIHSVVRGDRVYFLSEGLTLRTLPWLIEKFETEGPSALAADGHELKLIEIPDGVDWYIYKDDDLSEEVHEKHRIWK